MDNEATSLSTFQSIQSELSTSHLNGLFQERPTSTDYVDRNEIHLFHNELKSTWVWVIDDVCNIQKSRT